MTVRRRWWVLLGAALLCACTRHGTPTPAQVCGHALELRAAHDQLGIPEHLDLLRDCMIHAQAARDDGYDCAYGSVTECIEAADTIEQLADCSAGQRYLGRLAP